MSTPPRIGLCTDSASHLPPALAERYGVEVVPATITVDGVDHLDGFDLCPDRFYGLFGHGHRPEVVTSPPSAGQFAAAYETLLERGCTAILGIHVSSAVSATVNAARMAARTVDVPVKVVDTGAVGFGIGAAVWAAAEAAAQGAPLDEVMAIAERVIAATHHVFLAGAPGGLGRVTTDNVPVATDGQVPLLALRGSAVEVVSVVPTAVDAVNAMAHCVLRNTQPVKVAVGHSDAASVPLADALAAALGEAAIVHDVVRYRIGPAVGAHMGPGSVGCVAFPADVTPSSPAPGAPAAS
ncbi:MAG: DegV family EDD domain-containing protein [Acidimicrobiaceae bacterium]|nr:DegV family EDD domain-containing protein [Ilumatobacter sp.]MCB9380679.1 DegV family EDD domain-containing protein [Acidimicrobiaceae bacterium]MCO5329165.1 DegV family EDD domain-containing protein [Ilumatobacteraceae bacterium]